MTYITEKSEFTGDDVPLLETGTPVKGYDGTSIGPANEQAQVLANRTRFLKQELETLQDDVAALTDAKEGILLKISDNEEDIQALDKTVDALAEKADQLTASFQDLTIGLGQATTDIADNKLALHQNTTDIKKLNTTQTQQGWDVDQLTFDSLKFNDALNNVKDQLTHKQPTLITEENIKRVLGQDLLNLHDSHDISLADAPDFAQVLQQHLTTDDTLTLSLSTDGRTLRLATAGENHRTGFIATPVKGVKAGQEVEIKPPRRPGNNLRAYALKTVTLTKQANLTVKFTTDINGDATSPFYDVSPGEPLPNRISLLPDVTSNTRWSTLNTLQFDATQYSDTRVAFSADGNSWFTLSTQDDNGHQWVSLGVLSVDRNSADQLVKQGITLYNFNALPGSVLAQWLDSRDAPPSLFVAVASPVSSQDQGFIPASMTATFNPATALSLKSAYSVPVTLTRDSVIFKPNAAGDYVFCFESQ